MSNKQHHAQWGSRVGFIMAAVGSAVGLGNIWKFPYMVGESGGSAFVLAYLVCIALIGFPILVAEWMIGRRGQRNPMDSFANVAVSEGRSRNWAVVGVVGILGAFLILSFYSVIGGWALNYMTKLASGDFTGLDGAAVEGVFNTMLASPGTLTIWHTVFMLITGGIVALGVTGGIEKASKVMIPLLALILFIIVGYNVVNGGFGEAVSYLFTPDFSKLFGEGASDIFLAALGHAFFTLSLGMGIMVTYGSYLGKDISLLSMARTVVIMDTVIALAAGLAIFPIIFSHGMDPASGPGLIFVSLPIAFGSMTAGAILGTLFFLLITFAALTSSISLIEPSIEFLEERTSMNRTTAVILASIAIWLLGVAALLSFNMWSDVMIFGNNIFDFLDKLTSKFMLPITGLAAIVFAGWFMNQDSVRQELGLSGGSWSLWQVIAKFVAPIGVIIVFISALFS
ncbi:sodium-dependent transporter [Psychrobacter sanguinis]|uniref:sodium-dependent transporter n=1 Tax=Psychrobacter sanguinis TaxID=861445 RepID=UPI00020C6590|nr:sodium-dependent transporter [Psychrobacter sanguinis]EGK09819.1 NSS family amino acid:sodium (Na+) symporter [Psychrobacter sp. 1501(2011)]MCC3307150.1 sodium-dependent transporter [Psychrobacter sanguinis]MCC3345068.1 sodium-dependent transporter [Psychrobacter sanguinis]MCD9152440.1 sodium-dependent transporter [Psychrobacter sanguinis]UEC24514.1 sodium-dependent transporter [Psychrobacter sanguinis]